MIVAVGSICPVMIARTGLLDEVLETGTASTSGYVVVLRDFGLTSKCQECELRANATKRPKTQSREPKPPQETLQTANGSPTSVKALLNAAPATNGARELPSSAAQSQHSVNGYQGMHDGHLATDPQRHQPVPRSRGIPLPPLPQPHLTPGYAHHLGPPPLYAPPPDRQTPSGYQLSLPSIPSQTAYHRDPASPQRYTSHQSPMLHDDRRPTFPHLPHQAPSRVIRQHYGSYAGHASPVPAPYPLQQFPPERYSGPDAQPRPYPVPSPERRLYENNRPT